MNKYFDKESLYELPSGATVHPCRLIIKDGTLMWKHALCQYESVYLPMSESCEQHIIKTAQRLEELNSWCSQDLEPWQSFKIYAWYSPYDAELVNGINVYFTHSVLDNHETYAILKPHVQEHETLDLRDGLLFFSRC